MTFITKNVIKNPNRTLSTTAGNSEGRQSHDHCQDSTWMDDFSYDIVGGLEELWLLWTRCAQMTMWNSCSTCWTEGYHDREEKTCQKSRNSRHQTTLHTRLYFRIKGKIIKMFIKCPVLNKKEKNASNVNSHSWKEENLSLLKFSLNEKNGRPRHVLFNHMQSGDAVRKWDDLLGKDIKKQTYINSNVGDFWEGRLTLLSE